MRNSAGASFYYTADALGSTILLTDSAQAKAASYGCDSWGITTATGAQAAANPWQYAGGYKDAATGYTKFGARYYAPGIGRLSQPDPSGLEANRYLYGGANPINNTDPTGYFFACGTMLCPDADSGAYCSPSAGCSPPIGAPEPSSSLRGAVACYVGGYAFPIGLISGPIGALTVVGMGTQLLGC